ncbi:PAS domain S-box protein [Halothiobacillus diazotrophicus]|nr:PAS domain S-box protein [Halothiobacillus diazotrophicus]
MSFRLKTILGIGLIEALLLAALIYTVLGYLHSSNERQLVHRAESEATLVATMAKNPVLSSDLAALQSLTQEVLVNHDIVFVRILDARGAVLAQLGGLDALSRPFHPDRRVADVQDDIFDVAEPIEVDDIAYGRVELGVNVQSLLDSEAEALHVSLLIAAVGMVLVLLFSLVLGLYLTRQLTALKLGARAIAKGKLGYQIPVQGRDELTDTAHAFNRMSKDLAEASGRREAVLRTALDCIMTADGRGVITEFNPAAEIVFGYPREQVVNRVSLDALFPPRLGRLFQRIVRHYQRTGRFRFARRRFELEGRRSNGEVFPAEVAITLTRLGGDALFTVYLRDITERRAVEDTVRTLSRAVEQSPVSVVLTDLEGNIEFVNAKLLAVSGYDAEEVIGRNPRMFQSGQTDLAVYQELWGRLLAGEEWTGELVNRKKNGELYWEQASISAVRDANGRPAHYLAVKEDISERKRIEAALQRSEAQFRRFFEQNSSVMLLVEPDFGTIVAANEQAAKYYGYPLVYLTGLSVSNLTASSPDQPNELRGQLINEHESPLLARHRLSSGEVRDVEIRSTPFVSEGRSLLFSIVHDVTERIQAERALMEAESRLRIFIERFPGGVLVESAERRVVLANQGFCDLFTLSKSPVDLLGGSCRICMRQVGAHAALPGQFQKQTETLVEGGQPQLAQEIQLRDGRVVSRDYVPIRRDDELMGHIWLFRDITQQKRAEEKLQQAANVFTHAREGIMITDLNGNILEVNETFTRITGYSRAEALGKNHRFLSSGRQEPEFFAALRRELIDKGYWHGEVWNRRKNGEVYVAVLTVSTVCDADGVPRQYVALFSDVTAQKERHQKQLEHIAHYDALTGLINRSLLTDRLQQAMVQTQIQGSAIAVIMIDLDDFKQINETEGHAAGDHVLLTIADRLKRHLGEGDSLARLGGDEFVAVLTHLPDMEARAALLGDLLSEVAAPILDGERSFQVSASLGVTFYPQPENVDAEQLLRQSDQAMYQAKLSGKNRYYLFDPDEDRNIRGHFETLERIRLGIAQNEFELFYQPKVNMRTGQIVGMEALIRWRHPEHGLLAPSSFLPIIEDSPLEIDMGDWVLDAALAQMAAWQKSGYTFTVSINVGGRQLLQPDFVSSLQATLANYPEIRPNLLELEILESSALEDAVQVSHVINQCRTFGVEFALDDFGTGYSSLAYLKYLSATTLKIDQSFIRNMLQDPNDLAIVEGVLGLATAFRRTVIAEGVETVAHGQMLLRLGCELGQGYGIARPMPGREVDGWIAGWRADPLWLELEPVPRSDLPLLFAIVDHNAWVHAIERHLRGEVDEPLMLGEHECRFGQWLHGAGLSRYGSNPSFAAIDSLHHRIHEQASELVHVLSRQDDASAQAGLAELQRLSRELLARLDELLRTRAD